MNASNKKTNLKLETDKEEATLRIDESKTFIKRAKEYLK